MFSVYTEDTLLLESLHVVEVSATLARYPVITSAPVQQTLVEFINPCDEPQSIAIPEDPVAPVIYSYTDIPVTTQVVPFEVYAPICPVTYECVSIKSQSASIECGAPIVRFDSEIGSVTIFTYDMKKYPPGAYDVTIKGTVGVTSKL